MKTPYNKVTAIYERAIAGDVEALGDIVGVLGNVGITLRQDDGRLRQVNLSTPIVERDVIVAGLRYEKRDGSHSEDHFVFGATFPSEVHRFYGKRLADVFSEYKGTHKQRADFDSVPSYGLTLPNTVTLNIRT
jgi:hypothetical protein